MSANRYSKCPRCVESESLRQKEALEAATAAYGKVSSSDYAKMLDDAKPRQLSETFAEYYDLGMEGRTFKMDYSAGCNVCGLEVRVKTEKRCAEKRGET